MIVDLFNLVAFFGNFIQTKYVFFNFYQMRNKYKFAIKPTINVINSRNDHKIDFILL